MKKQLEILSYEEISQVIGGSDCQFCKKGLSCLCTINDDMAKATIGVGWTLVAISTLMIVIPAGLIIKDKCSSQYMRI